MNQVPVWSCIHDCVSIMILVTGELMGGVLVCITRYRYGKCQTCHSHLVSLREEAWSLSRDSRPAGRIVKEQGLLEAFSVLD